MPLGFDCKYSDFSECVRKNQDKNNPEAYCGWLKKETEEKCRGRSKEPVDRLNEAISKGLAELGF